MPTGFYKNYVIDIAQCPTQYGAVYVRQEQAAESPALDRRLTPRLWTGEEVCYHSSWAMNPPESTCISQKNLETIESQENQSLWTNLQIDGDHKGEWIYSGLMNGTLEIGHDGSYQPELANNVCAGATVIHCLRTDQYVELTWV